MYFNYIKYILYYILYDISYIIRLLKKKILIREII